MAIDRRGASGGGAERGARRRVARVGDPRGRVRAANGTATTSKTENREPKNLSNAPLNEKPLTAMEIGQTAAFLCSPLASGITGSTVYVDNGLNAMGLAGDSKSLEKATE